MRIVQRRIRTVENYLTGIEDNGSFFVGLTGLNNFVNPLVRIGFNQNIIIGLQVLPSIIGPITRVNANGSYIIRRDLPKEVLFRERDIRDWRGNTHTVFMPYERFQRIPIAAPCIELQIRNGADNNPVLVAPSLIKNGRNMSIIKHVINLFLEVFGECELLQSNLLPAFNVQLTKLNWNIFPAGNYPWQVLAPRIQGIINAVNQQHRTVIQRRIQRISDHTPNFVATGNAGFKGYMVFGFLNKDFFILESIYSGNATYVLGLNWEEISKFSKEEILTQNLHQRRIVHTQDWEVQIDNLLS